MNITVLPNTQNVSTPPGRYNRGLGRKIGFILTRWFYLIRLINKWIFCPKNPNDKDSEGTQRCQVHGHFDEGGHFIEISYASKQVVKTTFQIVVSCVVK